MRTASTWCLPILLLMRVTAGAYVLSLPPKRTATRRSLATVCMSGSLTAMADIEALAEHVTQLREDGVANHATVVRQLEAEMYGC